MQRESACCHERVRRGDRFLDARKREEKESPVAARGSRTQDVVFVIVDDDEDDDESRRHG